MFAGSSLAEERVEGVVSSPDGLVTGHLAIRLDPVLQTVQLPAGIADLDSGLANVYADTLTLDGKRAVRLNSWLVCRHFEFKTESVLLKTNLR